VPELPETETIARDLDRLIVGHRIGAVKVRRSDVLRGTSSKAFASRLIGRTVGRVWRRAKTVVIELGADLHLLVTPRFSGALLVTEGSEQAGSHIVVTWSLDGGRALSYRDVRRLGTLSLVDARGLARFDAGLGVEPLDPAFTADCLADALGGSRQAIKRTLMDARKLAGIGNIYANEVLWLAGVDPSRSARVLTVEEVTRVHSAILDILPRAIAARGTSFRDYRDALGAQGGFAAQLRAYGRGGEPCYRCGARLVETHAIDGRSTVLCYRCQL
jgi:formamidopyrimidine-DNA glycosylase